MITTYGLLCSAGLLDRLRPRGPQLIFLDADFSSLSISCGLYVLYKAARVTDVPNIYIYIYIYIGIAHVLLVYVGLAPIRKIPSDRRARDRE